MMHRDKQKSECTQKKKKKKMVKSKYDLWHNHIVTVNFLALITHYRCHH